MKRRLFALLFTILISSVTNLFGQESFSDYNFDKTKTYIFELQDGTKFIGSILQSDKLFVVVQTSSIPKIEIPFLKIKKIKVVDPSNLKNGEYWFPNPNRTRYLFSPSAFTLKKGEGYYQNTYGFLNSVNIGLSDHISIGIGLEFLSTFATLSAGSFDPVFFITPKIGYQITDKFHAGAGVLYINIPEFFGTDRRSGLGIAYGIGTYGTPDHNITGGLGWGFFEGEFSNLPFVTISGTTRISRRTALVTENWIIPSGDYHALISYGVRFFGEKLTVDLAFINGSGIAEVFILGIPYVDFVVKF